MSQQETGTTGNAEIQEIWALFREVARRQEEAGKQIKDVAKRQEEVTKQQEETNKQIERTSIKVEQLNETVNALTGKWGRFVEGLVAPGAVRMFNEKGIEVHQTYQRIDAQKNGDTMEIDVLVVNDEYAIAISVKSTLSVDDVDSHIECLTNFREFFPYLADKKLLGAVAGIVIDEGAGKYAYRKGLFVIAQSGETVNILNDEKFKPKEW